MASAVGKKNPITSGRASLAEVPPPFWTTPRGRSWVGVATVGFATSYFTGYTLLHTYLLDRYMNFVHLYKNGFHVNLTPSVIIRSHEALYDVKVQEKVERAVRFFHVTGFDMFHAGSTKMRGGSIIGIPKHFTYRSVDDVERHDIQVEQKPVEWSTDGGQLLLDSLILSERAQKFAIAREIAMSDTQGPLLRGFISTTSVLSYYMITRTINERYQGFARPKSFRIFVYSMVGTFIFGCWATLQDILTKSHERWADDRVANLGIDYARGGVEFYSKILERNMGLRALMGPSGESRFTFYGNDAESIRQKHVPFTDRKKNVELIANKLSSAASSNVQSKDQTTTEGQAKD